MASSSSSAQAAPPLPSNVHVSRHPCLLAKLSQLRSKDTGAKEVKALVHEIALIVGCEALAEAVEAVPGPTVRLLPIVRCPVCLFLSGQLPRVPRGFVHAVRRLRPLTCPTPPTCQLTLPQASTPLGFAYPTTTILPQSLSLVPILRSGLAMVDALETLLPKPVPVHHLGMYREPSTLEPVEYYNNLPYHVPESASASALATPSEPPAGLDSKQLGALSLGLDPTTSAAPATPPPRSPAASSLAIVLDPVIATGGTCVAAIQTLKEWGVRRVMVISLLGADEGVRRAATEWQEATDIWLAGLDSELTHQGMLKPGLGDVGDRLFLTIGR